MLDPRLQLELREHPGGRPVMRQSWRHLTFLHFACDPEEVQRTLPSGLTVDTFPDASGRERAWIGLVPFLMQNVRFSGLPGIHGTHTFPETNVRTYVHREGRLPGVWFYSLDAFNRLAVQVARTAFALPYFYAQMAVEAEENRVDYLSERSGAHCEVSVQFEDGAQPVESGTLEFFLLERYLLYAERAGQLYTGRVWHSPYEVSPIENAQADETLVRAAGFEPRHFTHQAFSAGVDVEVFPLRRLIV